MRSTAGVLQSNVLVLNRFFMAIHVISVRRAFCLLAKESAEVIHIEDGQYNSYRFDSWVELSQLKERWPKESDDHTEWIRTVSLEIRVPRIIRLLFYDRLPRQEVKFNRRNIFARDGNRCQYCGRKFPMGQLSLDYVIPKGRGGKSVWSNIVCCCFDCNVRKGGRRPEDVGMSLIRKPFKPRRNPLIQVKLGHPKYQSWQQFLDNAYWSVELKP